MKKHKCDGCKYKTEYQAMGFKPNGVCNREHNLIQAEKSYNAEVCPFSDVKPDEMTVKEAINIILRSVVHSVKSRENLSEALFIIQKAFEKQIPKKYEVWNGQCSCPNCNVMFGNYDDLKLLKSWKMDYCKFCGQALDWSDNDKNE